MTNLKRLSVIFPSVLLAATGLLAACGKSNAKEPEGAMEKAGEQAEQAGQQAEKAGAATDEAAGDAAQKLDEAGKK